MTITEHELSLMTWSSRAVTIDAVSYPRRLVTVVAMPYETDAFITEEDGRQFWERFSRNAFNGVEQRTAGIYACRDHNRERPVGKAHKLHPRRPEGLVAEIKIAPTPIGEETLVLAGEGVLATSLSFGVKPGGDEWSERGQRRVVNTAYPRHIAFVTEPAYEDARVLSVRHRHPSAQLVDVSATPLLDEVLAQWADDDLRSRFNLTGD